MRTAFVTLLLAAPLVSSPALATDLHVPGDAATIPAAIALAQNGDTIHVGPGTWTGAVDFGGKTLRLVSDGGFGVTTIDGGAASFAVNIPATPGTCMLTGFSIVGGLTARVHMGDDATLSRCRIGGGPGYGVHMPIVGISTPRKIQDCLITGNTTSGVFGTIAILERCVIDGNGSSATPSGGGVQGGLTTSLLDSVVSHNTAQKGGGASGAIQITGTLFLENQATVSGGALWASLSQDFTPPQEYVDDVFLGNTAPLAGGVHLPEPSFAFSPPVHLRSCTFAGNQDGQGNVGLLSEINDIEFGFTALERCTFAGDSLKFVKGALLSDTIVRDGTITPGTSLTVRYSNIEGGWPGTGNFDADPQWVDAPHVFALLPGSPCIDTGDPSPNLVDPDGSPADVGALPLAAFADARRAHFGHLGLPKLSGAGSLEPASPVTLSLVRARPGASAALLLGLDAIHTGFKGGVLVPQPDMLVPGLPLNASGALTLAATWPTGIPSGFSVWLQVWMPDAGAPKGLAASNALKATTP